MKTKLVIGLLLAVVALGGGYAWWQQQLKPASSDSTEVAFIVPKNQTAVVTLDQLQARKLISSALVAKIYLKATGLDKKIQSGTFLLSPGQTLPELLTALTRGPKDVWVTLLEGWRREQIAARFQASGLNDFQAVDFLAQTRNLEGQLFPDTYLVPRSATASDVLKIMTDNFSQKAKIDPVVQRNDLILASLVEREGNSDTDRPVIAAILKKRLQAGWPLQVDATLQYTQGNASNWWPSAVNTKLPSAYNTYLHLGLPPTPIANPGLSAITAVLQSQPTPYWFYLHGLDGKVYFAKTIEEHNLNIDKYLKH